jgi:hypothetical protein
MARKSIPPPTLEQALAWLRDHAFDVAPDHDGPFRDGFRVSKYGCVCVLASGPKPEKFSDDVKHVVFTMRPHVLVGGEPAVLLDRGYQKFLKTSRLEVAATAAHLKSLHQFQEELAQAIGRDQNYNQALGTVSDSYQYDRVQGRPDARP